jgi:plasmid stabilization system protein ParE
MRRRIRRHPAVADDITGTASYIADNSVRAAIRFVDAVETTLKWLIRHPGAGALREFDDPRLARVRSWSVQGFRKHLILYEIEATGIYILAILHGARDLPRVLPDRVS